MCRIYFQVKRVRSPVLRIVSQLARIAGARIARSYIILPNIHRHHLVEVLQCYLIAV